MKHYLASLTIITVCICLKGTELAAQNLPNIKLLAQQNNLFTNQERQCLSSISNRNFPGAQRVAVEALAACDRALAASGNNALLWQNRAIALEILGRYEEAISAWDRAIAIDPRYQSSRDRAVSELERWSSGWASNRPLRVSNSQVSRLTEALRLTILNFKPLQPPLDPLYTDWKYSPRSLTILARICTKRGIPADEVAANPNLARSIMECAVRHHLNEEFYNTGNNELESVRRAAAVFWYGLSNYNSDPVLADFTQRVVKLYQQLSSGSSPRS